MDELLTFFRDSAWGAAGALVAVISAGIAYRFNPKEKVKKLQFERFDDRLIGLKSNQDERLQLLYDGKPRSIIRLVRYQFRNIGTETISSSDFERPLSFIVVGGGKGELLRSTVEVQFPPQLHLDINQVGPKATIAPAMLNPGDRFAVTLLLADDCQVQLDYRIVGLSKIEDETSSPQSDRRSTVPWPVRWATLAIVLGFCSAIGLWAFEFGQEIARLERSK